MANELVLNKILIIKGILAEKCGLHPDLYEELSDLLDDIRILNDAKDSALAELSHENGKLPIPHVSGSDERWVCQKCGELVDGRNVTFEEYHEGCGGRCV